ncbi:MAG: anaerobic ribonucleoside-triphosphate reductase activating protein [Lachnospiraceae bacterium]|nr:anaerobic ribonucleoside-triphosphate reductase activating protein [Lachnospiraceae bacterium]
MKICGLQKLTLLDFPGKVACTVFLGGCDFCCPFCHNSELIIDSCKYIHSTGASAPNNTAVLPHKTLPETIPMTDFFSFLGKRRGLLDGVAVTGGEPTLHRDLPDFLRQIHEMGFAVKLDTNGNHPDMLSTLLEMNLVDYVAMDIKNAPSRYSKTIGKHEFDLSSVRRSVSLLMRGTVDYEFRTTVVAEFHDDTVFPEIGQWIQGAKRYFLQCFVDRDTVLEAGLHAPSEEELHRYAQLVQPYVQSVALRGV